MVDWRGPHPPTPLNPEATASERVEYYRRYRKYLNRRIAFEAHSNKWDNVVNIVYRWLMIKIFKKDPKPHFDNNY